jgi:hypothetical protein
MSTKKRNSLRRHNFLSAKETNIPSLSGGGGVSGKPAAADKGGAKGGQPTAVTQGVDASKAVVVQTSGEGSAQSDVEMLPTNRTLPAELPNGGLNGGPHLLGTGSTQGFNWGRYFSPSVEFDVAKGIKHHFTAPYDDQDHRCAQGAPAVRKDKKIKLHDNATAQSGSLAWERKQLDVYGLRTALRAPTTLRLSEVVGEDTGVNEAGFNEMKFKEKRRDEFILGKPIDEFDPNTENDGRVADHNRTPEGAIPNSAIKQQEALQALPQVARTAVKIV